MEKRAFVGRLLFPISLLLPILATIFVTLHADLSFPIGLWKAQQTTPWLWLVDVLPIICAFYGKFLSQPVLGSRSAPLLIVILMLLFLMPCSVMVYAWQETRGSIITLHHTRQASQLQTIALRIYIQTSQKPTSDVRADLTQMSQIRKEIKFSSPSAIMATESAWNQFYLEAIRPKTLSLSTTLRMRETADRLAHALETDSKIERDEAAQLLLGGIVSALLAMALALQLFNQLRVVESQLLLGQKQQLQMNQQLEMANAKLEEANQQLATVNTQLAHTASRDSLTGLYNRRALDERLLIEWNRAVRYQEPLTLAIIDVDYFKTYNDSFGHPAGDAILETIGMILQHAVRVTDVATRYGGDEFLILLPQTSEEDAIRIAERIRAAIQAAPWKNRAITVSIGLAERTATMIHSRELLDAADVALYTAKKTRNYICSSLSAPSSDKQAA